MSDRARDYYTVWMGDLPPNVRRSHVKDFFEDYGTIGGIRLMNNFGFIDFKHKKDAKDAVKELNGEKLKGCRIRLEISDGPGGKKKKGEDYDAFSSPQTTYERPFRTKYTLVVDNLSTNYSWADLKNYMRRAGEVTYTDAHVRSGEGRGEVCFKDRKGLYRAMKKLQRAKLAGKRIKLKIVEDGSREVPESSDDDRSSRSRSSSYSSYSSRSSGSSRSRSRSSSGSSRSRSRGRSRSRSDSRDRKKEDSRERDSPKKKKRDARKKSRSKSPKKDRKRSRSGSRSRGKKDKKERKSRSRSRSKTPKKSKKASRRREHSDSESDRGGKKSRKSRRSYSR